MSARNRSSVYVRSMLYVLHGLPLSNRIVGCLSGTHDKKPTVYLLTFLFIRDKIYSFVTNDESVEKNTVRISNICELKEIGTH